MLAADPQPLSAPLARSADGRWLGGVCAGLAPVRNLRVGWLRLAFAVAALAGGIGIALYLACWLIMPAADEAPGLPRSGGIVAVARACTACVGLAGLALVAALLTVFGFGWVAVGLAAAVLVGVLAWPRSAAPAWALLPVAALTLPALAVAATGLRLAPQVGSSVLAPRTAVAVSGTVYRSGLDTMLIDLRRTPLPASGSVPLRIDAGVRRTIVALPADRCVHVVVNYRVDPFAVRLGALLTGRTRATFSGVVVFGRLFGGASGSVADPGGRRGPVLSIDFSSQGGSLYVRDYPATVWPGAQPDWPGYQVHLEPRPVTRGLRAKPARRLIAAWRARRAAQEANARLIDRLMPGPCGAPARGQS